MKSNPSQDPLQRDLREWSNTSETGQGHSQPKRGKGKGKHAGKGTTTRTRLDLRMMMDSARRVILVLKVRELILSGDSQSGSSSLCVLRSEVQECHDRFDGIAKFVDKSFFRYAGE